MVNYRQIESPGRLATSRADFESHRTGAGFRHKADQIDMDPVLSFAPIVPPDIDNVQGTLAAMLNIIQSGNDFVTIGSGTVSMGTYTVGVGGLPTIESCFAAAIDALRFKESGGIILLKSGVYNFVSTVTLPAGISVMGELGGTILNATADFPIFTIEECPTVGINYTHAPAPSTIPADGYRQNKLFNLTFFDNYLQNTAILVGATSCFIQLKRGANVEIDKCSFFGKYQGNPGTSVTMTRQAVATDINASSYNTLLTVKNSVVFSTQKAITFEIDTTKSNRLSVNHNRFWCTGIISSINPVDRNIILFDGCDADFCNNDIKFGVYDNNQSVDCFIYCNSYPGQISTLIITGNKVRITTATDYHNSLIHMVNASPDTGIYFKSVITGNTCVGSNDSNDWYIVVGDGETTIGDINGERALSYIYNYYTQENDVTNQTESNLHEQITIFLKAGAYIIDGTDFITSATSFAFKLIGLPHSGNLPRISFNTTAPALNGQYLYFGSHIENISFEAPSNYLYYIAPVDTFVKPDVPAVRNIYVKEIIIKNCYFYNTGIYIASTATATPTLDFNGVCLIEKCFFFMDKQANLTGNTVAATRLYAIRHTLPNYRLIIRNCATKNLFYGMFLQTTNSSVAGYNDVTVEDCSIQYYGEPNIFAVGNSANLIFIDMARNVVLKNNTFDLSNFDTSGFGTSLGTAIQIGGDTSSGNISTYVSVEGNRFIGYDTFSDFLIAYFINGFENINICNNSTLNCPLAYKLSLINDNVQMYPYNVNIESNINVGSTNSYGFCIINTTYNEPGGDFYGEVNIRNNEIDMTNKGATSDRETSLQPYYPNDAGTYLLGVISIDVKDAIINIENNSIIDFQTNQLTDQEALISCVRFRSARICENKLELTNHNILRYIYSIFTSDTYPTTTGLITNYNDVKILGNDITHFGDGALTTDDHEGGIFAIYTKFITIQHNSVKALDGGTLLRFITAFAGADDADASIGEITYNAIYSQTAAGAYLNEGDNAITYIPPAGVQTVVKMVANRNRGQKFIKDINCYDFIQYGYNSYTANYPEMKATVLVSQRATGGGYTGLFDFNHVSNLNKTDQMDINTLVPSWRSAAEPLPKGLYYTNALDENNKGLAAVCDLLPTPKYKHQVLIPIHIDDFVKLNYMEIPIYLYSNGDTPTAPIFVASASLILCNTVDTPTRISGVIGSVLPITVSYWERRSKSMAGLDSYKINLHHDFLGTEFGDAGQWLTPKYNKSFADALAPSAQAYIVLALDSTGGTAYPGTNIYFAIPYARITYIY